MSDFNELWAAFQQWCSDACESSAKLELDSDGSGSIYMEEWMGDWKLRRSVLSWANMGDGIAAMRLDIEQRFPGLESFKDEADPGRARRRKHRKLVEILRAGRPAADASTPGATAAQPTDQPAVSPEPSVTQ